MAILPCVPIMPCFIPPHTVVTSVSPLSGSVSGGTRITLIGKGAEYAHFLINTNKDAK